MIVAQHRVPSDELGEEIRQHVANKIGPIARPKRVIIVPDLPKTRTGKIMRRLLRDVAEGRDLGDTTTLADPTVVGVDPAPSAAEGARQRPVTDIWVPTTGTGAPARSPPGPPSCSTWTACCPTRRGRQHYLDRPFRDWEAFFQACGDDDLIAEVARLLEVLDPDLRVAAAHRPPAAGPRPDPGLAPALRPALGSARDARLGRLRLVARASSAGRWGSSATYGFELRLAFEDDRRNVDMFHAEGVPCVYIHSGYYD